MWFQMMVGGTIHPAFDQLCLSRTGRGIITDGSRLLGLVSRLVGRVTAKGALADRKLDLASRGVKRPPVFTVIRAGEGIRTLDVHLGNLAGIA